MKRKKRFLFPAMLMTLCLFTGCGASKAESVPYEEMAANTSGFSSDSESSSPETAEEEIAEESGKNTMSENDLAHRKLIRTVDIMMQTKGFDQLKSDLEKTIQSHGGYIESSSLETPSYEGASRYYHLTVRVPSDHLDSFLEQTGSLGTITSKSENTEDVTLDYVDSTAYRDSLTTEYEKVTALLEQAQDLDQILVLESKLSELRYSIDSIESQIRTYDNLIEYSTVNISVEEVEFVKPVKDDVWTRLSGTFQNSFSNVKDFLVDSFIFLIGNLPVFIILAIAIFMIVLIIRLVIRKINKKSALNNGKKQEPPEKEPSK